MNTMRVLIVPAGSGMAITAIKGLKKDPAIEVLAADIDPLAPGGGYDSNVPGTEDRHYAAWATLFGKKARTSSGLYKQIPE